MHRQASAENFSIAFVPTFTADGTTVISNLFDRKAPVRHVLPGSVLFLHGEAANSVYHVVSGTIRCCTISKDGRRQIFRFAQGGDFLGLADFDTWRYTAEAVDHVILRAISRECVEKTMRENPRVMCAVRGLLVNELAIREQQLISIAYDAAAERLQRFLKDYADRRASTGFTVLPMTRQDIGDHLGLTLETVSRAFSSLRKAGVIEMKGSDRFRIATQDIAQAA